jgi:hypothetical protein
LAVDYVYRIEQPHVSGQLAKVCAAIAEAARADGTARPERVPAGL